MLGTTMTGTRKQMYGNSAAQTSMSVWLTMLQKPTATVPAEEPKKLSKAQRRAQQAALNKKLWDEA
jgi:hypothetical protein